MTQPSSVGSSAENLGIWWAVLRQTLVDVRVGRRAVASAEEDHAGHDERQGG
jgi:hypothetical protein